MFDKLMNDICYIINPDSSWYLATMSNSMLNELRISNCLLKCDMLQIPEDKIEQYRKDGRYYLLELKQDDYCRMRSFFCHVRKPKKIPDLNGCRVVTLSEYRELWSSVLDILKTSPVAINGEMYLGYVGGIPTSGSVLLRNKDNELEEVSLLEVTSIAPYVPSDNIRRLLSGVYKYKKSLVTLDRDILQTYYGDVLMSKLESKGVRYKHCYMDILLNGDMHSEFYYRNKYGISEEFHNIHDLLKLCKKYGTKSGDTVCRARRLASVNAILAGKQSLYVTIPDGAVLEEIESETHKFIVYYVNAVIGCGSVAVYAVDNASARSSALSECRRLHGGETEIVGVTNHKGHTDGFALSPAITRTKLYHIWEALGCDYVGNLNSYYTKIAMLGKEIGIDEIPEEHVKFVFVNTLAKKYRKSNEIEFFYFCKWLIKFYQYYFDNTIDTVFKKAVKPICISNIKKQWKPGTKYVGEYGVVESNGMAELRFNGQLVGKTVIKG